MKKIMLITMLLAGTLTHAEEVGSVSQNQPASDNLKKEKTPAEIIKKATAAAESANSRRIKNSKSDVDEIIMSDQHKDELKKIVYLIQDVHLSPLSKARKDKIMTTLEMSVYARCAAYKGSAAIFMASLIPKLSSEDTRLLCAKYAAGTFGKTDTRCVKALCGLLNSDEYSPSFKCKLIIYRGLSSWATDAELLECFKKEYVKDISNSERYMLAQMLAWIGDPTGASRLIESLEAHGDDPMIRALVRATLIKLYSVDLGDDTEAWKKLVEKGSPIIKRKGQPLNNDIFD